MSGKVGERVAAVSEKLFRLKTVGADFLETQLKRCLSTFDITLLGVGHMIGAGVYVLTGSVAKNMAGPGIVLSFFFAGIASLLSALCYAEFGARVPKAGSAYTYTYITVGEFWAFTIGWNIILEHMLGAAAVARSWSGYLDSLVGHVIKNGTISAVGKISVGNFFGDYPDFVAFLVVIIVAIFMGYGTKTSTNFNTIFTIINMFVILFVIIFGFTLADINNWTNTDNGGFLPMGFSGVLAGAASCFFAYIGFDSMATSGEEASDPGKSIPIATFVSMSIVSTSYILMSGALTLMVPYNLISADSAFADAFEQRGISWAKYVVAIGALSGMTTSLVGSLFALPRCVYAMAKDGLLFRTLAQIHPKTQVPTLAVTVFGSITAVIALLFSIETLVEFLSIGTLMAYTIVSSSVIILRYQPSRIIDPHAPQVEPALEQIDDDTEGLVEGGDARAGRLKARYAFLEPLEARFRPGSVPAWAVLAMIANFFVVAAVTANGNWYDWWVILLTLIFGAGTIASFLLICAHHQSDPPKRFKVPFVPLIPALSVWLNLILMLHLAPVTWIRLVVWLAVGYMVYFFYGIKHSQENPEARETLNDTLICTPAATPGRESAPLPGTSIEHPQPTESSTKSYGTDEPQ